MALQYIESFDEKDTLATVKLLLDDRGGADARRGLLETFNEKMEEPEHESGAFNSGIVCLPLYLSSRTRPQECFEKLLEP
ncbi:hypothetical protein ACE6H2_002360 [Prunus campanulata]